jgi:hypothetical protein
MLSDGSGHEGVLETAIDPKEWQLELERVVPRLMAVQSQIAGGAGGGKEWRDRLLQTKQHQDAIERDNCLGGLIGLASDMRGVSERIRQKESFINTLPFKPPRQLSLSIASWCWSFWSRFAVQVFRSAMCVVTEAEAEYRAYVG